MSYLEVTIDIAFNKINIMMKFIPYNLRFLIAIIDFTMNILSFIETSLGKIFSNRSVNQL